MLPGTCHLSPDKSILEMLLSVVLGMRPESEWLGHVPFSDLVFCAMESGRLALHNIPDRPCGAFQGDR